MAHHHGDDLGTLSGVLCAPVHLQTHRDGTGADKDEEQLKKTINSGHAAELFASRPGSPSLLTGAVIRRVIATAHKRLAENEWAWPAKTAEVGRWLRTLGPR